MGWNFLPPYSYSPDLAPSDFQLFCPLKNALRGSHFAKNQWPETQHDCRILTLQQSCMRPAHSVSHKGTKSVLIMKETWWKNNLNFWGCSHGTCKFHFNCIHSFCKKKKKNSRNYFVMPCILVQIQCRFCEDLFILYLDSTAHFLLLFIPFPPLFHSS